VRPGTVEASASFDQRDKAVAESFFGTLKSELVYLTEFKRREEAKSDATIPEGHRALRHARHLGAPSSWSGFTTTALDPKALGFKGGVFDGSYLVRGAGC
jgi:hypothetical protein